MFGVLPNQQKFLFCNYAATILLFSVEFGCCFLVNGNVSFQSLVDMAPKYILEQFLQQELLINITEHEVHTTLFQFLWDKLKEKEEGCHFIS